MGPPLWADVFTLKSVNTAVRYPSQILNKPGNGPFDWVFHGVEDSSTLYGGDHATIWRRPSNIMVSAIVFAHHATTCNQFHDASAPLGRPPATTRARSRLVPAVASNMRRLVTPLAGGWSA